MRPLSRAAVAALALLAVACGGSRAPGGAMRTNPDVITAEELSRFPAVTAREAIERIRPRFLRTRGPSSISTPDADRVIVYMDNTRMGGVEVLEQIRVHEIREIRYLNAVDATSRYGTGHTGGAIIIIRR